MSEIGKLPKGWSKSHLEDVAIWSSGGTPSRKVASYFEGNIPWIKTGELGDKIIIKADEHISEEAISNSSAKIFPKYSVALAMYGATIGKSSILGMEASTNQACAVGVADAVIPEYLYYYLISQTKKFIHAGKGGAQPNISQQLVKSWPIDVAPKKEQVRIVDKIDELFSELDAGIKELKAAQVKLKHYRQSLLKSAVEGALTQKWRDDNKDKIEETGQELLNRILIERKQRWEQNKLEEFKDKGKNPPKNWQDKYPEPVQPDTTDLPELPEGWVWASLDMLGEIVSGVTKGAKRKVEVKKRPVPYLRVANVQRGYLDLTEVKTIEATEADIKKYTLEHGDILFNEGGDRDKLGRGWVWYGEVENCIHQNHVFRMRSFIEDIIPEFISHHGNTFGKLWFQHTGKQTTNLASINKGILQSFPVPLAPIEEQKAVIEFLEEELALLDKQEEYSLNALNSAEAQRKNILKSAFSGKLVPQDKNDEPASLLLGAIKKEREILAKQTKTKRPRKKINRSPYD